MVFSWVQFNVLIEEFNFLHFWGYFWIGKYNTIPRKTIICWAVTKSSTICKEFLTISVYLDQCLIDKVPNISTLIHWILLLEIGIFVHITSRVSTPMYVFAA